ncbi:MAG: hypothetical protein M1818_000335 [Claussenomyces sp. TS43310]|nr:MAG: hypothetical protein M1818_000335 [Claussenomyces sp. TS43310]
MEFDTTTPLYSTSDKSSFAYVSARDRWPVILTGAIDDVHRAVADAKDEAKIAEGKRIIQDLAKFKYELQHDRQLTPILDDGKQDVAGYNKELAELDAPSWFNVPWLYAECYLYRRLSTYFSLSQYWKSYDVFARQKISTFRSSRPAVLELAARYKEIVLQIQDKSQPKADEAEKILFMEMCEICLWGNATDLSLLTSLTYEDIQKLQGSEARKASEKNILINDLETAYNLLQRSKDAKGQDRRVDIVLDNAGFELYVDLILAGFLLSAGLATTVVLHSKSIPWFVSDVVPADFAALLNALADPQSFYSTPSDDEKHAGKTPGPLSRKEADDLAFLFQQWSGFHQEGQLILRPNNFWTEGGSYWRLPSSNSRLHDNLKESELVIFKGDLNYRKLTGDANWDPTTPFTEALGPMGPGSGINVLALRTCKADVVVGLRPGEDERLKEMDGGGGDSGARKWAWSGNALSNNSSTFTGHYCVAADILTSPTIFAATAKPRHDRQQGYHHIVQVAATESHASRTQPDASATTGPSSPVLISSNISAGATENSRGDQLTPSPRIPSQSARPSHPAQPEVVSPRRRSLRDASNPRSIVPQTSFAPPLAGTNSSRALWNRNRSRPQHPVLPRTGRLWNPANSTPRNLVPPPQASRLQTRSKVERREAEARAVKLIHPQIHSPGQEESGGDWPLLTLQEQRASKHSNGPGSARAGLHVEYSGSLNSQQRVSLPKSVQGAEDKGKGRQVDADHQISYSIEAFQYQISREEGNQQSPASRKPGQFIATTAANITTEPFPTLGPREAFVMADVEQGSFTRPSHEGIGPALSLSSAQSSIHGSAIEPVDQADPNLEWGPSHPCYPHLNPHVPTSSPEYRSTRIIRIRRDWLLEGDLAPTFSGLYPEILADAGLGEAEFRNVVEQLNRELTSAFSPFNWRNVLDSLLGLLTGWIWDDLGVTAIKSRLQKVERDLEARNEKARKSGSSAVFIGLRRTGYLTLDIQIPTPQIGEIDDAEADVQSAPSRGEGNGSVVQ